jgi:GxxExxY protein
MPIHFGAEIRRLDDEEFKARVYEVMRHVFDVHGELGRLFHENIYQREVAFRVPDAQREVLVEMRFDGFCKPYYLDLLVAGGAVFEMKAVESLSERHRRQLMQYLFLTGLPHGKLVNLRPDRVEHEFVNNTLTFSDRTCFAVANDAWHELGTASLQQSTIAMLRDWGTGLDLGLYEEAAAHLCGQPSNAETEIEIRLGSRLLGIQHMRLAALGVALRITALPSGRHAEYRANLERLLDHTDLRAIQWINITQRLVQFQTIEKKGR